MPGDPKHIFFAVLNWGLGHAARSLPILQELQDQGYRLTLASNDQALDFMKARLPDLNMVELPDYDAQYRWNNMAMNLAMQAPAMWKAVEEEHRIVQSYHTHDPIQLVISDQRYGCYVPNVPSICITHQLTLNARKRLTARMANKIHHQWLARFSELWVPDLPSVPGLAGYLSHGECPVPVVYTGPISRLSEAKKQPKDQKFDWVVLLSGPEPARTKLEHKILSLLTESTKKVVIIRGKVDDSERRWVGDHTFVIGHLHEEELADYIAQSKGIICRSGYSTLMDLAALGRQAALIPTPGQPEQLYLAELCAKAYRWPVFLQSEWTKLPTLSCMKNAIPLPSTQKYYWTSRVLQRVRHWLNYTYSS